jgi:hypothetical protein
LSGIGSAFAAATGACAPRVPNQYPAPAALAGYETGKVDFATVLDAQRQIRQARLTLIRTRAEARMRLAEIERLLGEEL